jgi:hypothetical protein
MQWPALTWSDIDKAKYCWDWWGVDVGAEIYRHVPENNERTKRAIEDSPFYWGSGAWNMETMKSGYSGMEL